MEKFIRKVEYKLYQNKLKRLGLREVFICCGNKRVCSIGLE